MKAQYLRDKGIKVRSKGGMVRKCNTWKIRDQRRTQKKKMELKDALS